MGTEFAASVLDAANATDIIPPGHNGCDLPDCRYRFALEDSDRYFCRHGNVHAPDHLVDAEVCHRCEQRLRECLLPRPAPTLPYRPKREQGPSGPWQYISLEQLAADVRQLIGQLPADLKAVAGIPRSGMLPAAQIAAVYHLPLFAVCEQRGMFPIGHGSRLEPSDVSCGKLLIVDDSVYSGLELQKARRTLRERHATMKPLFAAVYPRPAAIASLDFYARVAPEPHLFEWNLFNCNQTRQFAFDLDGVLCEDWVGDEDDGQSYEEFLRHARPRWLPRRQAVPLIVTARLERHRQATEEWLRRHDVRFDQLVMGPWPSAGERRRSFDAGLYKGQAYLDSRCTLFVESDERQAHAIFQFTKRPVLCPTTGRVFQCSAA